MSNKSYQYSKQDLDDLEMLGGIYFTVRQNYFFITGPREAILLQKLVNFSQMKCREVGRKYDGWFVFEVKVCQQHLNMNEKTQGTLLNNLIEQGFINTKKKGSPPTRRVWINFRKIKEELRKIRWDEDTDESGHSPPNRGEPFPPKSGAMIPPKSGATIYRRKQRESNSRVPSTAARSRSETKTSRSTNGETARVLPTKVTNAPSLTGISKSKSRELAELLCDTVIKFRRQKSPPDLNEWCKPITQLLKKEGDVEVEKALRWYCSVYTKYRNEEWFPLIECGKSLKDKYPKILNCQARLPLYLNKARNNQRPALDGEQVNYGGGSQKIYKLDGTVVEERD